MSAESLLPQELSEATDMQQLQDENQRLRDENDSLKAALKQRDDTIKQREEDNRQLKIAVDLLAERRRSALLLVGEVPSSEADLVAATALMHERKLLMSRYCTCSAQFRNEQAAG